MSGWQARLWTANLAPLPGGAFVWRPLPSAGHYFALPVPALGQPAMHARTASAVPRACWPPPAATLLRLHFSMQAGSFAAVAGAIITMKPES